MQSGLQAHHVIIPTGCLALNISPCFIRQPWKQTPRPATKPKHHARRILKCWCVDFLGTIPMKTECRAAPSVSCLQPLKSKQRSRDSTDSSCRARSVRPLSSRSWCHDASHPHTFRTFIHSSLESPETLMFHLRSAQEHPAHASMNSP